MTPPLLHHALGHDRLDISDTFYCAELEDEQRIRACASYEHWITGCEKEGAAQENDTAVYELASTLVRRPLGGFESPTPTMQQLLAFTRLMAILGAELDNKEAEGTFCMLAAILHENEESYKGMVGLGMVPVGEVPRWLEYEHRSWIPKRGEEKRDVAREAHYLWLPSASLKEFIRRMVPFVDGEPIVRKKADGSEERFKINFRVNSIQRLVDTYGSMREAARNFHYEAVVQPPRLARIGGGFF